MHLCIGLPTGRQRSSLYFEAVRSERVLDTQNTTKDMCPIGLAGHLLSDKWIPIIIRDIALFDRRCFNEILRENQEGISSGALASRLQHMVQLQMLSVQKSDLHAQKKLYFLSNAGIEFMPILFQLALWTAQFHKPAPEVLEFVNRFHLNRQGMGERFLLRLREIHIYRTVEPKALWWLHEKL